MFLILFIQHSINESKNANKKDSQKFLITFFFNCKYIHAIKQSNLLNFKH